MTLNREEQLQDVNCNLDCIQESIQNCKEAIEWNQFELKQLEEEKLNLLSEKYDIEKQLVG